MSLFTVKTEGFQTAGLNFHALKEKLEQQVKNKKLGDDAQIRWTGAKGLYAKSGTWNVFGYAPFGSGAILRGDKFLAARQEIARSINLAYGNRTINGELVGDYVVDRVLEARAREELGLKPDEPGDQQAIENKKGTLHLRVKDLAEIEKEIVALRDNRLLPRKERMHPELMSSVGYMRSAAQAGEAAEKGTQKIIDAVVDDLAAHKWSQMDPKKRAELDPEERRELNKKYHAEAEAETISLMSYKGMKTFYRGHMEDEEEVNLFEGGLTTSNVAGASQMLRLENVRSENVTALLQATELPQHINACSERLMELHKELKSHAKELDDGKIFDHLAAHGKPELDESLRDVEVAVKQILEQNLAAIRRLKNMSYPDDITNPDLRQREYNTLIENIENMDLLLADLHDIVKESDGALPTAAGDSIDGLVGAAQKFCAETLELASGVHPMLRASDSIDKKPRPFLMTLPGLMRRLSPDDVDSIVADGLGHKIKAPDILFKADSTGRWSTRFLANDHNKHIAKIANGYRAYRDLLNGDVSRLTHEDRAVINKFRERLVKAVRDNERLTAIIQRRQKILGQNPNSEIDGELQQAKAQRNALLLLLYPRLTSVSEEDQLAFSLARAAGDDEPQPSVGNGGQVLQESGGDASVSTDRNSSVNAPLDVSPPRVGIEQSGRQATVMAASQNPVLGAPSNELGSQEPGYETYTEDLLVDEEDPLCLDDGAWIETRGNIEANLVLDYFRADVNAGDDRAPQDN